MIFYDEIYDLFFAWKQFMIFYDFFLSFFFKMFFSFFF
jgi:hypothetical protein